MKKLLVLGLSCVLLLLIGCVTEEDPTTGLDGLPKATTSGTITGPILHEADNGKTFTVKPNTSITVTLKSNEPQNYRWFLPNLPNPFVLKVTASKFLGPTTSHPGSTQTWTFVTAAPGLAEVTLMYANSLAPSPPQVYKFVVVVK
jgi:predicted secreted protein